MLKSATTIYGEGSFGALCLLTRSWFDGVVYGDGKMLPPPGSWARRGWGGCAGAPGGWEGEAAIPISPYREEELFMLDKFLQMLGNRFCH